MKKRAVVHLERDPHAWRRGLKGWGVCGTDRHSTNLTMSPRAVTCRVCRKTAVFREAREAVRTGAVWSIYSTYDALHKFLIGVAQAARGGEAK